MSEEHVKLLKAAKTILAQDATKIYVCSAVKTAAKRFYHANRLYKHSEPEVYDILTAIEIALSKTIFGGRHTVQTWLEERFGIYATPEELLQYRLSWIDNMIEYWKNKP
jgi:hypothetical protein